MLAINHLTHAQRKWNWKWKRKRKRTGRGSGRGGGGGGGGALVGRLLVSWNTSVKINYIKPNMYEIRTPNKIKNLENKRKQTLIPGNGI